MTLVLSMAVFVPSVLATCNPGRTNQVRAGYAGTQGSATNITGIKATIDEYNPWVSTNSEVSMWVMLNRGGTLWAQIGWMDDDNNNTETRSVFEQHITDAGSMVTVHYPAHSVGSHITYQQLYDPATDTFTMMDNGSIALTTVQHWVPTTYQVYGETHQRSDQMPGGTDAHAKFINTYRRLGTSWFSLTTAAGTNSTDYGAQRLSSVEYHIWDTGCSS